MKLLRATFVILGIASPCIAVDLGEIAVSGQSNAEIWIPVDTTALQVGTPKAKKENFEMTIRGAAVSQARTLTKPHPLIEKLEAMQTAEGVTLKLVATKNFENAYSVKTEKAGIRIAFFPNGERLGFEDEPLRIEDKSPKLAGGKNHLGDYALVTLIFVLAGVASAFAVKFIRTKTLNRGSRKYLIEQLSYCPVGQKGGVGLIKVGREFVLVGVTSQQITLLSTLPRLEAQYDEESVLERETFRDAVREEVKRMQVAV